MSPLYPDDRPAAAEPASSLNRVELEELVKRGVRRGALQAIGVYFVVTAVLAILIAWIRANW